MSEATMWTRARKALGGLDPVRVENPAHPGTPDVNWGGLCRHTDIRAEGWIELKWVRRAPRLPGTVLPLHHFTPQQRAWLLRRAARGGRVHVLLKVGPAWLLFDGKTAAEHLGKVTYHELNALAIRVWPRGLVEMELRKCLLTTGSS